ncbi:predicted protein [Plenodomus lingam JN3]|uniref:Predicted protein n=1 Tax=Leptosphaeria maculans (strain JN3 / isolate v23.1.3 / race Av1-4-5-6-7-8) TaxID=985895 RepID=E4ZMB8_LEPMJ|nr:predicted protein [Plenodomus lingam JN3]CBX92467.1 predicted protein [Plenodomus lingam JN3]
MPPIVLSSLTVNGLPASTNSGPDIKSNLACDIYHAAGRTSVLSLPYPCWVMRRTICLPQLCRAGHADNVRSRDRPTEPRGHGASLGNWSPKPGNAAFAAHAFDPRHRHNMTPIFTNIKRSNELWLSRPFHSTWQD